MKRVWAAGVGALVVLAAAIGVSSGSGGPVRPAIAYVSSASGSLPEAWVAAADGSHRQRLGPGEAPLLSPDGSTVAASLPARSGAALSLYPAAGGAPRRLLDASRESAVAESWSPDSRYLAVVLWSIDPSSDADSGLAVVDARTMHYRLLARGPIEGASFARDGSDRIAYARAASSAIGAPVDIHIAAADGTRDARITEDGRSLNPVWGRGGIAFDRERLRSSAGPSYQLWLMRPDGSDPKQLTHLPVPLQASGLVPIGFSGDGLRLLAEYEGPNGSQGWVAAVGSGRATRLRIAGQPVSAAGIMPGGTAALVDVVSSPNSPDQSQVEAFPLGGGRPRPLVGAAAASRFSVPANGPGEALRPHGRTIVLGHGSWCWFGDPRAVRVVGHYDQTFVGWIDWSGDIEVGAYDPGFGAMRTHVVGHLFHDDHGSPAIFVEPDKRITVFWSGHNGQAMRYRTTLRPEDISAWGPVRQVRSRLPGGFGFTYPNPQVLRGEGDKLYLFWRGASWSVDYATRTLDGRWSPAHELVGVSGQRPYLKVDSNGSDALALAFTDGHPRDLATSVYYAAYRGGSLWHAGGRWIARLGEGPIAPRQADVVYDGRARGVPAWVWDVAFDARGRPVILYATFPSPQNHAYWYARWDGSRWVSHLMTFAGPSISPRSIEVEYSGGMALDHRDPSTVYLSRRVNGSFELERWITRDGGYHWRHTTVVRTARAGTGDVRPLVARGSDGGPMSLLWLQGDYVDYSDYRTSVAALR